MNVPLSQRKVLVDIRDLHKSFGHNDVLRGINLTVRQHEVVCLIGPSGCGKSTLLRCINGLESIQSGSITVDGESVSGVGANLNAIRRDVGIVFQAYNLFPHMSVLRNITLAQQYALGTSRRRATDIAKSLLERVGLGAKADTYPDQLSGGQQQRVAIARALALGPRVLLLDEVTSALDPELVGEVLRLIREVADEGMTMVLATHEMAFARDVADTICLVFEGQVLEKATPAEIFNNPRQPRTRAFLGRAMQPGVLP